MNTPICEAIIVAEDDRELRKTLTSLLSDEGFLVFAAEDGHDAFEVMLTTDYPCLMFLDLTMPGCDGRQLLELMEQRPDPKPKIEVVIMSGAEEAEDFAHQRDLVLLKKPISVPSLLKVVEGFCRPRKKK
jgi:CheY-like chemotaxis protein